MSRPLLDLLAALVLTGVLVGTFLGRHRRVRLPLAVSAALLAGVAAALVFAGEALRLALEVRFGSAAVPGGPSPGVVLAAAALVAVTPGLVLGLRLWLRTAGAVALVAWVRRAVRS